jgi:hypothetical protein
MRRLVSTSLEATTVAMFFAISTVILLATRRWTLLRAGLAVLLGMATFLTLSKAGIAVVLVAGVYLMAIELRPLRHPGWIAEAGAAGLLFLVGGALLFQGSGAAAGVSTGALLHLEGLVEGLRVAANNFFGLGVGIGGGFATVRTGAESAIGTMLTQLGPPGALLWATWLLGTAAACAAFSLRLASDRLVGFGIAAALASFFATAALTESAGGLSGNWPYPFLAGMLLTAVTARREASTTRRGACASSDARTVGLLGSGGELDRSDG